MATIAEIRQQYPQYNDMSDQQLADKLYAAHYSDMPRQQFDEKVGLAPKVEGQPSVMDRIAASPVGRFVHDAVLQPAEAAISTVLPAAMTANASVLNGQIPTLVGPDAPNNKLAAMGNKALDASYQGALGRNRNTPGYAAARAQADKQIALAPTPLTSQFTAPFNSAIHGLGGLALSGGSLDASNAAADAQTQAQQGYSAQHPVLSAAAQMAGGLLLAPKLPTPNAAPAAQAVPSIADLKSAANAAYDRVDNAGHIISDTSYDKMVSDLKDTLASEGIDKTLHPNALAAYNRLEEAQGQPITFKGLDTLRKVAGDAIGASTMNKADQRLGYTIQNHIDDFVNDLKPTDLLGATDPQQTISDLSEARGLWSRASQAQTIQNQIDKAGIKASANYSQSGMENALRQQFKSLALNDKAMSRLSPEVQDAVKAVAKGSPVGNVLRAVGKYAPHGPVATTAGLGLGYMLGGPMGATEGGMASLAVPMAGEMARSGATAMTKAAAQRALDTAALGQAPAITAPFRAPTMPAQLPYGLPAPLLMQLQRQAQ